MKRGSGRSIVISALVAASLAGLIWVQVIYLAHAYERELRSFTQNVNGAMRSIVRKLETRETWTVVERVAIEGGLTEEEGMLMLRMEIDDSIGTGGGIMKIEEPMMRFDSIGLHLSVNEGRHICVITLDSLGAHVDTLWRDYFPKGMLGISSSSFDGCAMLKVVLDSSLTIVRSIDRLETAGRNPASDGAASMQRPGQAARPDSTSRMHRRYLVEKVLEDLEGRVLVPALERVSKGTLDSIIGVTLVEAGIGTEYAYGIHAGAEDSLILAVPEAHRAGLTATPFRTRLFPHDLTVRDDELRLYFPRQSSFLLGRERAFLALAVVSILVIAACFIYVIRTLERQRRFSSLLFDFINNMTHEFKTPISTISLASENLAGEEGAADGRKTRRYGRIIADESARMRRQVEKILQMAALEEGDLTVDPVPVDIHRLLEEAAATARLGIEHSGGSVTTRFDAHDPIVEADEIHLRNVVHNLLDNAAKYTREPVHIVVLTDDSADRMRFSIEDDGIGISAEDCRRVFDRYYRVPTGNIHDVKGFGLGLSYVKLIVEAHGGTVSVRSTAGRGSTFTIELPRRRASRARPAGPRSRED